VSGRPELTVMSAAEERRIGAEQAAEVARGGACHVASGMARCDVANLVAEHASELVLGVGEHEEPTRHEDLPARGREGVRLRHVDHREGVGEVAARGPGSQPPPPVQNVWNQIAQTAGMSFANSLEQNTRMFALLDTSLADGVIALYDSKYAYHRWRPVTAVQGADNDGNPAPLAVTALDPSYAGAQ